MRILAFKSSLWIFSPEAQREQRQMTLLCSVWISKRYSICELNRMNIKTVLLNCQRVTSIAKQFKTAIMCELTVIYGICGICLNLKVTYSWKYGDLLNYLKGESSIFKIMSFDLRLLCSIKVMSGWFGVSLSIPLYQWEPFSYFCVCVCHDTMWRSEEDC